MSQRQPLTSIRRPIVETSGSPVEPAYGYSFYGDWRAEG